MRSVEAALQDLLAGLAPLEGEMAGLEAIKGRVLGVDVCAAMTQPPFPAAAMDGYAVRFCDLEGGALSLNVIGEAPAGTPFEGAVGAGQAVRIFTGGVVPDGADHVVIQEDVERDGDVIAIKEPQNAPRHIRPAGVDFKAGDLLAPAGTRLHAVHGSIFAAANVARVEVVRQPKIALFSNGDELREPGADLAAGEIIADWGGAADYLGCAPDDEAALKTFFERGRDYDIIIPIGGASVGDYDYVKSAFAAVGGETIFEKVAVRPGKPLWHGRLGAARVIGLPGNPASAIVTAALFVKPVVQKLAGIMGAKADGVQAGGAVFERARLNAPLKANGRREAYLRGVAAISGAGEMAGAPTSGKSDEGRASLMVTPAGNQDSSLLSPFHEANALIRRPVDAPAASIGDVVEIVRIR